MDYDNFEQMVLGANLNVVKSRDLGELIGGNNQRSKISILRLDSF